MIDNFLFRLGYLLNKHHFLKLNSFKQRRMKMISLFTKNRFTLMGALLIFSKAATAEPTSGPVRITEVRPYIQTDIVYFHVDKPALCHPTASGHSFYLNTAEKNGKNAYAAVLTAYAMGKPVLLELSNTTKCSTAGAGAGFALQIQSIFIK